jgi:hypothetical protein
MQRIHWKSKISSKGNASPSTTRRGKRAYHEDIFRGYDWLIVGHENKSEVVGDLPS